MRNLQIRSEGGWQPVRNYSYRDLSDTLNSKVYASDVLPSGGSFDQWGNRIAVVDGNGTVSSVKYGPNGVYPTATVSNAQPTEFAVFDGEYDYTFSSERAGYDGWHDVTNGHGSISSTEKYTGQYSFKLDQSADEYDYFGIPVYPEASRNLSSYTVSFWVKSSALILVHYLAQDPTSCVDVTDTIQGTGSWQRVRRDFSNSECPGVNTVNIILSKVGGEAYFDDIRFHPIDAQVATTIYNDSSGSITASAGTDNLPVRFSYDAVGRPTTTLDHDNLLLSQVEYDYLRDSTYVVDTIVRHFDIGYGYEAVWLGELVVDSAQTIAWDCSWIHSETGCPGLLQHLCRITVNDTNVVYRAGSSASFEDSGTFPVLVGDTVTIEGMADCAICDTCNTSITVTHVRSLFQKVWKLTKK